jgi:uncharacterized membrane protein YoaK (UPF0700 family)
VVLLTLGTGALDAVTFVLLGKVFSSVITGNLALLGIAAGRQDATLARNGGLALAGYAVGVILASLFAGTPERGQPVWPRQVTLTLAIELAVVAAFDAGWLISGSHRGEWSQLTLLILSSSAMGMQSTAVRRLGQMSSTYLTSTLTGVLTALAIRRVPSDWQRSVGVILALVAGAVLGALAATKSPGWVPAAVILPLAVVVACSLTAASLPSVACSPCGGELTVAVACSPAAVGLPVSGLTGQSLATALLTSSGPLYSRSGMSSSASIASLSASLPRACSMSCCLLAG